MSSPQAKKRTSDRRFSVSWSRMVPRNAGYFASIASMTDDLDRVANFGQRAEVMWKNNANHFKKSFWRAVPAFRSMNLTA